MDRALIFTCDVNRPGSLESRLGLQRTMQYPCKNRLKIMQIKKLEKLREINGNQNGQKRRIEYTTK